jgi:hypothetical protein
MGGTERDTDWAKMLIHGIFGFLFGAALGFGTWAFWLSDKSSILLLVLTPGLVVGIVAALWGDDFWYSLRDSSWWQWFG